MKGYTIIEVLISTAIASFLSVALFVALRQTMAFQITVDNNIDANTRITTFQNQFEKDFMGFFVPSQAYELVKTGTAQAKPAKKAAEQIDKVFYATSNKKQFNLLSYTTTHAMQVYWGVTMGAPKPYAVRVVYRLVPDKDQEDTFTLQRQENKDLDFAHFETAQEKSNIRAYDILTNIKSMQITYLARVYKEEEKDVSKDSTQSDKGSKQTDADSVNKSKDKKNKKMPTWTYQEFNEWDWSPKKTKSKDKNQEAEKKKEKESRVPFYVKVDLVLWNVEHTREMPFSLVFVRKPFEMIELEKDTQEVKKEAQLPSFQPILDILKLPSGSSQKKVESQRVEKQEVVMAPNLLVNNREQPERKLGSFGYKRVKKS